MDHMKDEFANKIIEAAQRLLDATAVCQSPVKLPNPLPLLDPDIASDFIGDEVYECEHTAYVFPSINGDPYDTTFYDTWPDDDDIKCVAGTMAIEGMTLSDTSVNNINRIKLGEDVYSVLDEIKAKYAAGDYTYTLPQSEETK